MKKIVLLIILFSANAFAQDGENDISVQEHKKGSITITPTAGYQWLVIENPNGELSGYEGIAYGLRGAVRVLGESDGGLALGVLYQSTVSTHQSVAGEEMSSSELGALFEFQYNSFFLASSFSNRDVSVENIEKTASYSARTFGLGVGFNMSLSMSTDLGLSFWYKQGLGRKSTNSSLTGTLGDESLGGSYRGTLDAHCGI